MENTYGCTLYIHYTRRDSEFRSVISIFSETHFTRIVFPLPICFRNSRRNTDGVIFNGITAKYFAKTFCPYFIILGTLAKVRSIYRHAKYFRNFPGNTFDVRIFEYRRTIITVA